MLCNWQLKKTTSNRIEGKNHEPINTIQISARKAEAKYKKIFFGANPNRHVSGLFCFV